MCVCVCVCVCVCMHACVSVSACVCLCMQVCSMEIYVPLAKEGHFIKIKEILGVHFLLVISIYLYGSFL